MRLRDVISSNTDRVHIIQKDVAPFTLKTKEKENVANLSLLRYCAASINNTVHV